MTPTPEQVRILVEHCEQFRGSEAPGGYPGSLALCIIDAVQSTGVTYASVERVVQKYRNYRSSQGGDANTDSASDLVVSFAQLKGSEKWAATIGNGNRTSTKAGAPLKAAAIEAAAQTLAGAGINTADDMRATARDEHRIGAAGGEWRKIPGQKSGVTWHYLLMLAGVEGVKPDRMIIRFVADSLGLARNKVSTEFAAAAVRSAADSMGMSQTNLDHGIWRWQRRR